MEQAKPLTYTAFLDGNRLTTGPLHEVAVAVLRSQQAQPEGHPLVFSDASGQSADLDLRGGEEAVAARYTVAAPIQAPKGRGRPKLGVVAREVTLLPEHWDWLATQPGGASVALRKLVHEARRAARAVAALLHLAAVGVEDAVGEVGLGPAGRFEQQQLIAADAEVPVGQCAHLRGRQADRLAHAVDDHKVIAQTVHLGEPQPGGHAGSPSASRPA